jgi:hypothetical protein
MDRKSKAKTAGCNLIRFDWAMKRLLRNKADYVVLEGFLTVLLGERVKITGIGESEGNQTKADEKFNRVDILVENEAKEIFIIEIQNCRQVDYLSRMLFGTSKAITDHIKIGEKYTHVRKVYHINIVYFNLGQGEDYVYHGSTSFRGVHRGDELQLTPEQQKFFGKNAISKLYPEYYILKIKDFDRFKNGTVPIAKFASALSATGFSFSRAEIELMCHFFRDPKRSEWVNYLALCEAVESVEDGISGLGTVPLTGAEEAALVQLIRRWADLLMKRRWTFRRLFGGSPDGLMAVRAFQDKIATAGVFLKPDEWRLVTRKYKGSPAGEIDWQRFVSDTERDRILLM